jgi:(5-formylfuran-3-yl)methyl phosphate synthase
MGTGSGGPRKTLKLSMTRRCLSPFFHKLSILGTWYSEFGNLHPAPPSTTTRLTMQLLVSVRTAAEARVAMRGGAALIDVKEPARGSLGRASEVVIQEVVKVAGSTHTVSAALGELLENEHVLRVNGLSYVKWGLAGCASKPDWRDDTLRARTRVHDATPLTDLVAVAYADCHRAAAPPPQEICELACAHGFQAFLLDTWRKDGTTLLDWLRLAAIRDMVTHCRQSGVKTALAGGLGIKEIARLRALEPDWFAVRGAVCRRGVREDALNEDAVRALADLLHAGSERAFAEIDGAHL